jgi:hypothetical protein
MSPSSSPGNAERIFQLSLTELAFTLIFLLLLLAGAWARRETEAEASSRLAARPVAAAAPKLGDSAATPEPEAVPPASGLSREETEARGKLASLLAGRGAGADEIVTELLAANRAREEAARLRARVEELERGVTELVELAKVAGGGEGQGGTGTDAGAAADPRAAIVSALKFQAAFQNAAGETVPPERVESAGREYGAAIQAMQAARERGGDAGAGLETRNRDLEGQTAWLREKLRARGGLDYPPCWAEAETGRPQYLLSVEILGGGLRIAPAWPPERAADAAPLPGLNALLRPGLLSIDAFTAAVQELDAASRAKNCRHYVRLYNRVNRLDTFNRYRFAVEGYFYKYEAR